MEGDLDNWDGLMVCVRLWACSLWTWNLGMVTWRCWECVWCTCTVFLLVVKGGLAVEEYLLLYLLLGTTGPWGTLGGSLTGSSNGQALECLL